MQATLQGHLQSVVAKAPIQRQITDRHQTLQQVELVFDHLLNTFQFGSQRSLGFLSFIPLSGYDLKKAFDSSVQHFWPANQSQIYRTLAELETQGMVTKEVIEREERLDMKVYHITEAGRGELHAWLTTPQPERDDREPFLIQVYFGGQVSDDELLKVMRHKLKETEERLGLYEAVHEMIQNTPPKIQDKRAVFLSILTLEAGYVNNQSIAAWLRSAIERIENKNYTIQIGDQ